MLAYLKSLFRHYSMKNLGTFFAASLGTTVPFVAALVLPVLLASQPVLGLGILLGGFVVTGQVLAVSGRLLDRKFRKEKDVKGALGTAWAQGWAEGLVLTAVFLGFFSLAFSSVPYYWAQGSAFSVFSLVTLGVGSLLVLGGLPFYLPVRRRETLGLAGSIGRSFQLMNRNPLLAVVTLVLGLLSVVATVGSFGLFPGFAGIAALHQGVYDRAIEREADRE